MSTSLDKLGARPVGYSPKPRTIREQLEASLALPPRIEAGDFGDAGGDS